MKYDHMVKHNGVVYLAGEEVPVEELVETVDITLNGESIAKAVEEKTKRTRRTK